MSIMEKPNNYNTHSTTDNEELLANINPNSLIEGESNKMEVCHVSEIDTQILMDCMKIYEHVKSYLKKGMIQITGTDSDPILNFLSSVADSGILRLKISNAFTQFYNSPVFADPNYKLSLAFRNTSYGNTFNHSRELFGTNIKHATMMFYRRKKEEKTEYVQTLIKYIDGVTKTFHKSAIESWVVPFDYKLETSSVDSKILLSNKTSTLLQKWLRKEKNKSRVVKVTTNKILNVVIFSVGCKSHTIDFQPVIGSPLHVLQKVEKQGDYGSVSCESSFYVSLESLTLAIGICKIPGAVSPGLKFYSGDILEVLGVAVKSYCNPNVSLSVVLLKAEPSADINQSLEVHETQIVPEAALNSITPHCSPDILSTSGSYIPADNSDTEQRNKRKHTDKIKRGSKPKKSKLNFNPGL